MNDEERQRQMDFILQQQAQITVNVERVTVRLDRLTERVDALAEQVDALAEQVDALAGKVDALAGKVDALAEQVDALAEQVGALADSQQRAEQRWAQTEAGIRALLAIAEMHEREIRANDIQIAANGEQIAALQEAGRETDERLNALINTVERLIDERRNGGPRQV